MASVPIPIFPEIDPCPVDLGEGLADPQRQAGDLIGPEAKVIPTIRAADIKDTIVLYDVATTENFLIFRIEFVHYKGGISVCGNRAGHLRNSW